MQTICVYSSSSDALADEYYRDAKALGEMIAQRHYHLVYGGARIGLMGAVATAVKENHGKVTGIIPQKIHQMGIAFDLADELLVTPDLRERKARMEEKADAFIALPGGFGTLEETLEVMTLKQLRYHSKPIIFLNTLGFYNPLLEFFEQVYQGHFAKPDYRLLYHIAPDVPSIFQYLDTYQPTVIADKWFKKDK